MSAKNLIKVRAGEPPKKKTYILSELVGQNNYTIYILYRGIESFTISTINFSIHDSNKKNFQQKMIRRNK